MGPESELRKSMEIRSKAGIEGIRLVREMGEKVRRRGRVEAEKTAKSYSPPDSGLGLGGRPRFRLAGNSSAVESSGLCARGR